MMIREMINSVCTAEENQNKTGRLTFTIGNEFVLSVPNTEENRGRFWEIVAKFLIGDKTKELEYVLGENYAY